MAIVAEVEGAWKTQYGFDLTAQEWIDFAPANYLNSHSPETIFVQKAVVLRFHDRGRTVLVGDTLKRWIDGCVEVREIAPAERAAVLAEEFALAMG